jgi:hypothetical protein
MFLSFFAFFAWFLTVFLLSLACFCYLGRFIACSSACVERSAGHGSIATRYDLLYVSCAAIGLQNLPASDERCNDSAQRFFVVCPTLQAPTQLVQLPSDTTCSLQALISPFCVLDKAALQAVTTQLPT